MAIKEEDEWDRVKMGRFSDADEQLVKGVMGPWFKWSKSSSGFASGPKGKARSRSGGKSRGHSFVSRANTMNLEYAHIPRKQAIVKVRLCPMSVHAVMTLVRYVARLRPQDQKDDRYASVPLLDEFGMPVESKDALNVQQTWDLMTDAENLSKTARGFLKQGDLSALRAMDGRKRLRNVQVRHFIFSIKEDGNDDGVAMSFRSAVRAAVDEAFTAKGHKVLWAIHKGHSEHLHAHIVVKALSDFGGRIKCDPFGNYLISLREIFAQNLRCAGLDYGASRRVDRKRLRERVMAGCEPLNDNRPPWMQDEASRDPYANLKMWPTFFGDRAMENLARLDLARAALREAIEGKRGNDKKAVAAKALRESLDVEPEISTLSWKRFLWPSTHKAGNDDVPNEYQELLEAIRPMFHDPVEALASWQHMSVDGGYWNEHGKIKYPSRALANWTLLHRPELFGRVKAAAYEMADERILKKMLKKIVFPEPEQFPVVSGPNNAFLDYRKYVRINKDRAGVMAQMEGLHQRLNDDWPESWLVDVVRKAIGQTKRIEIGQSLPGHVASTQGVLGPSINAVTDKSVGPQKPGQGEVGKTKLESTDEVRLKPEINSSLIKPHKRQRGQGR